jgi:hypothetical protein
MRAAQPRRRAGAATLWVAAALAVAALVASPPPAAAQDAARPQLAGHTFVSTDLVPDAFVRTFVRNSLGYAQAAEIDYPALVVRGDTLLALQGSLIYAILGFEYQYAVKDWIAARVAIGARTRLGTQLSSLVADGVNLSSGSEFGWLVRLRQTRNISLCGELTVSNQSSTVIDVQQFAEDVIDGVPDPALIDAVPMVRTNGGLRCAWAVSRPLGVTLLAGGSYGESPWRREPDSWEYGLGASVDFDAGAAWGIPVGAALAYRQTSLPLLTTSGESDNAYSTVLRLAYIGRPDFIISLDLTGVMNRESDRREPIKAGGATISMRYYF